MAKKSTPKAKPKRKPSCKTWPACACILRGSVDDCKPDRRWPSDEQILAGKQWGNYANR